MCGWAAGRLGACPDTVRGCPALRVVLYPQAFVIPMIEMLQREPCASKHHVGGLVLSPTRELALQIKSVMAQFTDPLGIPIQLLTGGVDPLVDVEHFKQHGANILIATPGRLEDIFRRLPQLVGYIKGARLASRRAAAAPAPVKRGRRLLALACCITGQRRVFDRRLVGLLPGIHWARARAFLCGGGFLRRPVPTSP